MDNPVNILIEPDPADTQRYGAKAAGLRCLPKSWVPEFIVLEARPVKDFMARAAIFGEIREAISKMHSVSVMSKVYVRSSAPVETLSERGRLLSYSCGATPEAVCDATARIASHAESVGVVNLAIIVQRKIDAISLGHFSNERRVSRSEHEWLLEEHWPAARDIRLRPGGKSADITEPLYQRTLGDHVEEILGPVAATLTRADARHHIEWVTDREAMWIVQCDRETAQDRPSPCHEWLEQRGEEVEEAKYSILRPAAENKASRWRKAQHVRLFRDLELPYGNVLLLDDTNVIQQLAKGGCPRPLEEELQKLARWPVVVRTDVASSADGLLLPHSDALQDPAEIGEYLVATSRGLIAEANAGELAFLLHHFVAARVGAFAYARPDLSRVRIDATWGVPDSLLFHAHDTHEVDLTDPDRIQSNVRCKSYYVDVNGRGEWVEREAGWNWDWKSALTPEQVRTVAVSAHKVAITTDSPVQVMFFVGLAKGSGHPDVLPWFVQADEDFDPVLSGHSGVDAHRAERVLRTAEDLSALTSDLKTNSVGRPDLLIVLRPAAQLIRDASFLKEVGELAAARGIPVVLEGSILSHAFYVLRREGATVRERSSTSSRSAAQMPLNKLVRDKIPDLVLERSEDVSVLQVTGTELTQLLTLKAVEESFELAFAVGEDATLDELADLFEIVRSIAARFDLDITDITRLADEKRLARGGFEDGVVLVSTRLRMLGDAGQREQLEVFHRPGRIPPYRSMGDADDLVLHIPIRGVGLAIPTTLRCELPSGIQLEASVAYEIDGIQVTLREQSPQPQANQMTLDL